MATVTAVNVCAGVVGQASIVTVPPVQRPASQKMGCCVVGEVTASVAGVFAQTLVPPDQPVNDAQPVVTLVTLNGNASTFFCAVCSNAS